MKAKLIKTEDEYEAALAYIDTLMDAEPGSPEEAELDLFAHLVEIFEGEHYPIELPDPIEAIKFRMDQAGLTRKDMRQYLGSQSKVSEVLNYKRPLSLTMIRSLHKGLGIPAEVLLQEPGGEITDQVYCHQGFPFNEMVKSNYFPLFQGTINQAKDQAEELLTELFSIFEGNPPQPIFCRNSPREINHNALMAWQARVLHLAHAEDLKLFIKKEFADEYIRELVRLSYFKSGPRLARELLNKIGIHLIFQSHLPKTYLDGACMIAPWGNPAIGMTLRFDRLDYFWFTLLHELAHIHLHINEDHVVFFDDTEFTNHEDETTCEMEANQFARDHLIPPDYWKEIAPSLLVSSKNETIIKFADELRISQAIVAGRVRWELGNYRKHSRLVGNKQVREQLLEYE